MGQGKLQKHTIRWYSDGQPVWVSKVVDGACARQYYPGSSEKAFCCWEKQGEEGRAFDFRTPIHADLVLCAVYSEPAPGGEGRFAVGVGTGSLFVSRWKQTEALRMHKTEQNTYKITLTLYRGDVLQFKREDTWHGQAGIGSLVPRGERESFCFFGTPQHGDIVVQQDGEYEFEWNEQEQSVRAERTGDVPPCAAYPDWYIVGDMNAWRAEGAQKLQSEDGVYSAILEISQKDLAVHGDVCHFMLHNPETGQYRGASDGGHLTCPAGRYRITAGLPLGSLDIQPQEEGHVI